MTVPLNYALPERFLRPTPVLPEAEPLWVSAWQRKTPEIAGVVLMLVALAGILFGQQVFVRRQQRCEGILGGGRKDIGQIDDPPGECGDGLLCPCACRRTDPAQRYYE